MKNTITECKKKMLRIEVKAIPYELPAQVTIQHDRTT